MRHALQWGVGCSIALVMLAASLAATPAPRPALQPCGRHGGRCGTLVRPLDATGRVAGTVSVAFEVYPATGRREGTLVATEGGPGYPATASRDAYLALLGPLRRTHDLVLMDNRGTGRSGALACTAIDHAARLTPEGIGSCGRELGSRAALYGTAAAADDLDAILASLGAGPVDLYGDSYGTFFAQVFALRHPDRLRSLVLDGAYPLDGPDNVWLPHYAPAMRAKFDLACERDAICAALPGRSSERLAAALARLRTDTAPGFSAARFATVLFGSAPALATLTEADAAARAYLDGDPRPLGRLLDEADAATDSRDAAGPTAYSGALAAAVTCTDSLQVADPSLPPEARAAAFVAALAAREASHPDGFAPFSYREFLGLPADYRYLDECLHWPVADPAHPPAYLLGATQPHVALPVLVVSGDLDSITSVAEGAAAAADWPRATHVVIGNGLHVNALPHGRSRCAADIVRRFLRTHAVGSTPCAAGPVRLIGRFARRAADVPPLEASAGDASRATDRALAAAAVATLADVLAHGDASAGLRGGSIVAASTAKGRRWRLSAVRWTEDLEVSGRVTTRADGARGDASLTLRTDEGTLGTLRLHWNGTGDGSVSGTISGRRLAARAPLP
jgi:pimeloyl-ACP methyl ester carboxylesterase